MTRSLFDKYDSVADQFKGLFEAPYDGSYQTRAAESARRDFIRLTNWEINWTQAHGDFKNKEKAAEFTPYPHWRELHECCRDAIKQAAEHGIGYQGNSTCASLMDSAMHLLRKRYNFKTPSWWIPLIKLLRVKKNGGWEPSS